VKIERVEDDLQEAVCAYLKLVVPSEVIWLVVLAGTGRGIGRGAAKLLKLNYT